MLRVALLLGVAVALATAKPAQSRAKREVDAAEAQAHCLSVQASWDEHDFISADTRDRRGFFICVFTLQLDGTTVLSHSAHFFCADGNRFSEALNTCVFDTGLDVDPCVNKIAFHMPNFAKFGLPCNTYYQCDHHVSRLRCCPGILAFDVATATCVESPTTCKEATCPVDVFVPSTPDAVILVESECLLGSFIYTRLDEGHTYAMINLDRSVPWGLSEVVKQACPPGTLFMGADSDPTKCYCSWVGDIPPVEASPLAACKSFRYEGEPLATYLDQRLATITLEADGLNHGLCFAGAADSFVDIPYYSGNDWKSGFTVAFRYRFVAWAAHEPASLVTNGDDDTDPTVNVEVDDQGVKVNLVLDDDAVCEAHIAIPQVAPRIFPLPPPSYYDFTVRHDGTTLTLRHGTNTVSVECAGEIKIQQEPVRIGRSFAGCVDDLFICKASVEPFLQATPSK